jgi:hypothetical protein
MAFRAICAIVAFWFLADGLSALVAMDAIAGQRIDRGEVVR